MEIHRLFEHLMSVPYVVHVIDKDDFHHFMKDFQPYIQQYWESIRDIPLMEGFQGWNYAEPSIEKQLEYYVSLKLLDLKPGDIFMDVASCYSMFPSYVKDKYQCEVWRQDYYYKKGINNHCIGGDACAMPVPDNSFSKMTLHCSFEHFEDTKDGDLIVEMERVLKPGGQLCIIPFYCGYEYLEVKQNNYDTGCQFQRYYNPEMFKQRVFDRMKNMRLTFHWISNLESLGTGLYCHFALLFEKNI